MSCEALGAPEHETRAIVRSPHCSGISQGGFVMLNPICAPPPRYLCTKEATRFLSLSARTLEKHRTYRTGPLCRKIGGRVVYAIAICRLGLTPDSKPRRLIHAADRRQRGVAKRQLTASRTWTQVEIELRKRPSSIVLLVRRMCKSMRARGPHELATVCASVGGARFAYRFAPSASVVCRNLTCRVRQGPSSSCAAMALRRQIRCDRRLRRPRKSNALFFLL